MDFRILGPLEVLDEGRAVALGGSRQRALLALLLLHVNETLTSDRLIEDLWGESPPATAGKTVQVYVSRLRRALAHGSGDGAAGGGPIVTRDRGYELQLDLERLDSHRFERLVAEGRRELSGGDPKRAALALEEALSLWRGEPLAELAYEPFAQPGIARFKDLRLDAMEQLVDAKLALGGHSEVVGELEVLIGEHPFREHLRAQLMLALYRCDRQADALQAYQEARRTLVEQLGIEPGEHLRELERAILAQDSGLVWVATESPAAAQPPATDGRGAFVGRERELAALAAGLQEAFAGRGRLFLLVGEPGIGKSRLAEELMAEARARGARILVGRCWEAGGAPAYWPWVQSLRAASRGTDDSALRSQLGAGAAELAHILPELRERFADVPEPRSLEPDAARFRLFNATAEFLRSASEGQPLVLFLDDLHAADAPSLLLLRFVARELDSTRILLLGAYRDVDPGPGQPLTDMLVEVGREPVTRHLALGGLSESEVAQYVELTASEIASTEVAEGLHAETEGNPLFVGEIVRLLADEGMPLEAAREARFAIPESIRHVIARRLSHLSMECQRTLVLASVIGREFSLDTLARMGSRSEDELLELLDEALNARVLSELPDGIGRRRFAHVLIRDTLYEGLTSARRVQLHRLAVEALEALYGDEPGPHLAELAHHSVAGRDFQKGVGYARRAGERALTLLAYEESARLYEIALKALDHADHRDERARRELLVLRGEAESQAGNAVADLERAELLIHRAASLQAGRGYAASGVNEAYASARGACERAGDNDRLVSVIRGQWMFHLLRGQYQTALELSDEMLALGERHNHPARLAEGDLYRGLVQMYLANFDIAREHLDGAFRRCREPDRSDHIYEAQGDTGVGALAYLALVLWNLGYAQESRERSDLSLERAERVGGPVTCAQAWGMRSFLHLSRRELGEVGGWLEKTRAHSTDHDIGYWRAVSSLLAGWLQGRGGQLAPGTTLLEQSLDAYLRSGSRLGLPLFHILLGDLRLAAGDQRRALDELRVGEEYIAETGERLSESELFRFKGRALMAGDSPDPEGATAAYEQAAAAAQEQNAKLLELRALTQLAAHQRRLGETCSALDGVQVLCDWFGPTSELPDVVRARALAAAGWSLDERAAPRHGHRRTHADPR